MFPSSLRLSLALPFVLASSLSAGPLDPPVGPVAPTMKTIAQVEPRTPIESLPFTISQPGSYYLARNLTAAADGNGITINAPRVTLDLAGFTLFGGGFQGIAITGTANGNVTVRNGVIADWSLGGVVLPSAFGSVFEDLIVTTFSAAGGGSPGIQGPQSCRVQRCSVTGAVVGIRLARGSSIRDSAIASCLTDGIVLNGNATAVIGCSLDVNGSNSSHAQINAVNTSGCLVRECSINAAASTAGVRGGIAMVVQSCALSCFGGSIGIGVDSGSTVNDCTVSMGAGASAIGISAYRSRIAGCTILLSTDGTGIYAGSHSTVVGSSGVGGMTGISMVGIAGVLEDCRVADAVTGIQALGGQWLIARNRVTGGVQYNINSGNRVGPIIDATAASDLSLLAGANHPLANFRY